MRKILFITAAVLALGVGTAQARDNGYWNRSGFSVSHQFYPGLYSQPQYGSHAQTVTVGDDGPTEAEKAKAHQQRIECKPVIIHMDDQTIVQPASGCIK
jgi:hypothetical protein